MKGGEDGLDEIIAKALKGEIERLPPEGGDVDIRVRVKGDVVGGNKTVIVNPIRTPPPENPNQRQCPQCGGMTWSATRECVHCGRDLFAFDSQIGQARVKRRQTKAFLLFGGIAIAGAFLGKFFPESIRLGVYVGSFLSAMMAMAVIKD